MIQWLSRVFVSFFMLSLKSKFRQTLRELLSSIRRKKSQNNSCVQRQRHHETMLRSKMSLFLFLFHLWSKHLSLWHTPMHLATPKIQYILQLKVNILSQPIKMDWKEFDFICYFNGKLACALQWEDDWITAKSLWVSCVLFATRELKNGCFSKWCVATSWWIK